MDQMPRRHLLGSVAPVGIAATIAGGAFAQQPESKSLAVAANIRDFGALGDGVRDDTAAFQRAVDAKVGAVLVPRGRYRLTRPVAVELDRVGPMSVVGVGSPTLRMSGAGPALRFVGTHTGTADPNSFQENVWERQRMPMVEGIEIVGDHAEADGIEAVGTMQAIFTRVTVRKARHGIRLAVRNRNVLIGECHLYENRGAGVFLDNVDLHQTNISNCHISYNGGGGVVVLGGNVRNLQIGTCDIESNMAPDGPPTANVLIDTTGGSMAEAAIVGCTLQHNHNAADSANIRILGAGGIATRGQAPGNIAIADNVMSDVFVSVHLREARGVTIVGNTFWKGFSHDLHLEKSTNILIGPNLFDRNPAYRPDDSPNGILIEDSADCALTGLHMNGTRCPEAALVLRRCKRFNIANCTVLDCASAGILLDDVEESRVSGCLISNHDGPTNGFVPIRLTRGRHNLITANLVQGECELADGAGTVADNVHYQPG